jgi:hypothetical protein
LVRLELLKNSLPTQDYEAPRSYGDGATKTRECPPIGLGYKRYVLMYVMKTLRNSALKWVLVPPISPRLYLMYVHNYLAFSQHLKLTLNRLGSDFSIQ